METKTRLGSSRVGRPPSCTCGECKKCKKAAYMREWWRKKSAEERRAAIARRDPEAKRRNAQKSYDRNPEPAKARAKRWVSENPDARGDILKRWDERHPEKAAAHVAVGNAIRDRRLVPQPCEVCGAQPAQAHHDDYSKPLEVRWLCVTHHAAHHKAQRRGT